MTETIYLIFENVKKKIETPIDYDDLIESLKKEFNEEEEINKYVFKIKDKDGNEEIIPKNVEAEYFDRDLEIYVTKIDKDFSIFTSQYMPNQEPKEEKNKEHIEKIIIEKNDENDKSNEDLEKEYNNLLNSNKEKTIELIGIRSENEKMKKELEKLQEELEDIKKKPKKPKVNTTNYELEIAKLEQNYETKKSKLEDDLTKIKNSNKRNQDKIEELKLGTEHENEIKANLNNEQSELITKKNSISQTFERQNLVNKTAKPVFNVKKKKKNDFILNYIKKCFEENKKKKTDNDKKIIKEEEEKRKTIVFETFKSKLTNIRAKNNIKITKNRINNKKGNGVEENNQLKQKKKELDAALNNVRNELDNLKKNYKKEITKLQTELKEKKKEKKIKDEAEKQRIKDEEEKKREKDEEEKQRKIKEEAEKQRKIKEEAEKQRKIKEEEEERKKKLKEEEERKKKLKEEEEKKRKLEEERKKNAKKNKKEKDLNEKEEEYFEKEKVQELIRKGTIKNVHYSFECTNLMILQHYVYQGTESTKIPLILKNTGLFPWPPNATKLIFDKNYQIRGKTVNLNSLDKNEEQQCDVTIEGLGQLPVGEYESGVYLNINGINIGKMIKMKVIIKEKEDDPIDQYIETIKKFRTEYNLKDENEYSNDDLYNILMSNEFDLEKAFMCIIGEN